MIVLNKLHHSDEQWAALTKEPDEGPIFMVNLFKFREHQSYLKGITHHGWLGVSQRNLGSCNLTLRQFIRLPSRERSRLYHRIANDFKAQRVSKIDAFCDLPNKPHQAVHGRTMIC